MAIIIRRKIKTLIALSQVTTLLVKRIKSIPKSSAKLEQESGLTSLVRMVRVFKGVSLTKER